VRRRLVHLAAPVALLAAVTLAALLARPALEQGSARQRTTTTTTTTRPAETTAGGTASPPQKATQQRPRRTYTVEAGDTLSAIARKTGTTVSRLEQLNPAADPTALQVGQEIRVQ
jgi:LysM repeat protein